MKVSCKQHMMISGWALALLAVMATSSSAQLVTGWGSEVGFQAGTVTEGGAGSFTVVGTGNIGERAVLSTPVDFSFVGATISLDGTLQSSSATFNGNQQLRFGLFNNNGNALGTLSSGKWTGATASGWLGYIVEIGNGNGSGTTATFGRNGSGANAWLSTSGAAYSLASLTDTGAASANGTYALDLTLTRLSSTSVGISYSLVQTAGTGNFSATGSFTDNGGLSSGISSFNAVGFYTPGNGITTTLTGVAVVPEPSGLALVGCGLLGLATVLRRKKA